MSYRTNDPTGRSVSYRTNGFLYEAEWLWQRVSVKPSALEENSMNPDDLEENSMNPDDLEENSSWSRVRWKRISWIRMTWKRIPIEAECVGRDHNLGFVKQSWILNDYPVCEILVRHVDDEDYWMKACVALSVKEVTWNERCYGGNYGGVPRGVIGFLQNGHALMRWRYQSTAFGFN